MFILQWLCPALDPGFAQGGVGGGGRPWRVCKSKWGSGGGAPSRVRGRAKVNDSNENLPPCLRQNASHSHKQLEFWSMGRRGRPPIAGSATGWVMLQCVTLVIYLGNCYSSPVLNCLEIVFAVVCLSVCLQKVKQIFSEFLKEVA